MIKCGSPIRCGKPVSAIEIPASLLAHAAGVAIASGIEGKTDIAQLGGHVAFCAQSGQRGLLPSVPRCKRAGSQPGGREERL